MGVQPHRSRDVRRTAPGGRRLDRAAFRAGGQHLHRARLSGGACSPGRGRCWMPPPPLRAPWLWYLCTLATAAAAVALPTWAATVYLFLAPLSYAVIRVTPVRRGSALGCGAAGRGVRDHPRWGRADPHDPAASAAASVDAAQTTALARYSHAVRQHAPRSTRAGDSIVHDSVLTTLLSAAAPAPDSEALAAADGGDAIGHLQDAAPPPRRRDDRSAGQVASRIVGATATSPPRSRCRRRRTTRVGYPAVQATTPCIPPVQAMVNSLQHAGSAHVPGRTLAERRRHRTAGRCGSRSATPASGSIRCPPSRWAGSGCGSRSSSGSPVPVATCTSTPARGTARHPIVWHRRRGQRRREMA